VEAVESARAGLSPKKKGGREKEKKKTKEGGLLPQEGDVRKKKRKKTKEGKKVAPAKARFHVPSTKNFFFWFTSIWVWKWSISFEVSAPMRLSLQGSNVQRKFRKRTTLHSKSSTLKGLLYPG
jgi:hypothetical protein